MKSHRRLPLKTQSKLIYFMEKFPRVVKGAAVVLALVILGLVFGTTEILEFIERNFFNGS